MEKVIGIILLIMAGLAVFYIITHLDKLNSITLPVPEKVVKYFKIDPFKK